MKYIYFLFLTLSYFSVDAQIKVETFVESIDASGGVKWHQGDLYVANFGAALSNADGTQVYRISKDGTVHLFADGLQGASGNDFDANGDLFQSSISGGTVSKIAPDGNVSLYASQNITCNVGIVVNENDLFVCNCCGNSGNTISKVSPNGSVQTFSASPLLRCPNGITKDDADNLYVSNFDNGNIIKITPDGTASIFATTTGSAPSNGHITFSSRDQTLYVASHGAHAIFSLSLDGVLSRIAGTGQRSNVDGDDTVATFSRPNGIALNATEDTMYVNSSIPTTDAGGRPLNPSKIRMITGFRIPTTSVNKPRTPSFDIRISPNPASAILNLEIKSNLKIDGIQLLNLSGEVLIDRLMSSFSNNLQLDVSTFSKGHYLASIRSGQQVYSKVFIVQ